MTIPQSTIDGLLWTVQLPEDPEVGHMFFMSSISSMVVWDGRNWRQVVPTADWNLFLDDIRTPLCLSHADTPGSFVVARTVTEALNECEQKGLPSAMSLDHDLGEGQEDAPRFLWYLIDGHLDGKWDCSTIKLVQVHSMNPEGVKNLIGLWSGFCKDQGFGCEIRRVQVLPEK